VASSIHLWLRAAVVLALGLLAGLLPAAERRAAKPQLDPATAVDLFDAMDAKDIDVKLIMKDDTEARVFISNKTKKPLTVKLPDAFAAVPVLAQRGGVGGGGVGGGGMAGGAQQSMGGGMGGMGGGMGGGMMGGMGMMNIPPEKIAQLKVPTVCLEHGKKEPKPNIPYEIKKIEVVTSKPEVRELLTALGKKNLNQRAAQAAAWHLANDMSWEQLANKQIEHLDGSSELYFHPQEIAAGMQIASGAVAQAAEVEAKAPKTSPGEAVETAKAVTVSE
jgi:hypothetical protein